MHYNASAAAPGGIFNPATRKPARPQHLLVQHVVDLTAVTVPGLKRAIERAWLTTLPATDGALAELNRPRESHVHQWLRGARPGAARYAGSNSQGDAWRRGSSFNDVDQTQLSA